MMLWFLAALVAAFAVLPAPTVDYRDLGNLDFEQGAVDSFPPGWTARGALRRGYRVAITDRNPHGGRHAALIQRDSVVWMPDYGALAKKIDARPYRGRRVRVAGWLRFEPLPGLPGLGSACLYLRVDRERNQAGFANDTQDRPVRAGEWERREVVGTVAADADTIAFGAYLDRSGRAWVDDLSFTPLGPIGEGDQPPRPLSERGLQNLVAFARLLGYVRHFHPSDESVAADWDSFAIAGVDDVERARTGAELAAVLERLFHPLAPTVRVGTRPLPPLTPTKLRAAGPEPGRMTGWWHHGWPGLAGNFVYHGRRPVLTVGAAPDSIHPIGSEIQSDLGGGVWCSVPLTLYVDRAGTLPRATARVTGVHRPEGWTPSGGDRATRVADVILLWNIAQHFYPYFDVVGTDWVAQLPIALREAAVDTNGAAFEMTLHRLVATLRDGHGGVSSPYSEYAALPLAWTLVGDRLVVTRADSSVAARVRPGDEVIAIAGRPIAEWVKEGGAIKSAATPQFLRVRVAQSLRVLPGTDTVQVELRSPAGQTRREWLTHNNTTWLKPPRPDSIASLKPGVIYLDLDRITDADMNRVLPQLVEARGVIFDLRGYPSRITPQPMLSHLIDSTITSARWNVPVVTLPDRKDMTFDFSNWPVSPQAPRIKGRVAFLIDGSAISYAETCLGMVEHYRLAELVGEPTAGTNGNITGVHLPGGYTATFTGMQVLKHDGSRHHGVGILPTVPVSRTLAGIAAGRDEQLEKAIEVVSR